MYKPLISIALASYNGEKYIEQQLKSIRSQTITDIEIVVSDDRSTDNTLEIVQRLHNEGAIKLLDNKEKLGVIKNFENALRHCSGQYVAFSDQDDVWMPDKIEKSLSLMKALEAKYGSEMPCLVYTDATVVDENLQITHKSYLKLKKLNPKNVQLRHLIVENVPTGCTMLMNSALAESVKNIPSNVTMHDVFVAMTASCFGKMAYLDKPTLLYRQHANNVYGVAYKTYLASLKSTFYVLFDKSTRLGFLSKEIAQAKAFQQHFKKTLTVNDLLLLEGFILLSGKSKLGRIYFLLKSGIAKGYWLRTINLFIKI